MTPEDFDKLPPALAIKVLAQIMPGFAGRIESLEVPKVPRAPKYDFKMWRKGAVICNIPSRLPLPCLAGDQPAG